MTPSSPSPHSWPQYTHRPIYFLYWSGLLVTNNKKLSGIGLIRKEILSKDIGLLTKVLWRLKSKTSHHSQDDIFTEQPCYLHRKLTSLWCHKNGFWCDWLVWLSGLRASLWTKMSPVGFSVRAQVWIAGQVPSRGHMRDNHTLMFFSLSFSLPSPL